jgi:hypothetical protein
MSDGYLLRSPDAHQAQGPPVDTQEMGFPGTYEAGTVMVTRQSLILFA